MKIRSVELTNLFPASDGTVSTSSDQTGRTPGYNWSVYATNILKDKAYSSRPLPELVLPYLSAYKAESGVFALISKESQEKFKLSAGLLVDHPFVLCAEKILQRTGIIVFFLIVGF